MTQLCLTKHKLLTNHKGDIVKKQPKTTKSTNTSKSQIMGILQLFVVASVSFMGNVVLMGVDDIIAKAMTLPALIWVAITLVNKFTR